MPDDVNVGERMIGLLMGMSPRGFCDQCASDALGFPLATITHHADNLMGNIHVQRAVRRCSPCRSTKRMVTRIVR